MRLKKFTKTALTLCGAVFVSSMVNFAGASPTAPSSFAENTFEHQLDNGLKIIVRENHRAPVVTTMVWYKVGSVDEPRGLGGISHMLEHMMFKGTDTLGPNEHSTIIANLGGRDNAFTSYDYTAYFENLPSWELETALKLEADRMQNLVLTEVDFAPERLVVANERRQRTDSSPQAKFFEAFNATVWNTSAYRNPIIGWMPEIEAWTLDDLKDWYARYYAPNNATLVVVGDVDAKQTFALAEHHFGGIPKSEGIVHPNEFETEQLGEKRIHLNIPANMPLLLMVYKVPSINTADDKNDVYALLLASTILDGLDSSRITKRLVRQEQIALSTGNYYSFDRRYDTTVLFSAVPTAGVSLSAIESEIKAEIARLQTEKVSEAELKRIINLYRASEIYSQDSIYQQAMMLGSTTTTGEGWQNREKLLDELEKVTPEMIQEVAQRYFIDQRLTVGLLEPKALPESEPESESDPAMESAIEPVAESTDTKESTDESQGA